MTDQEQRDVQLLLWGHIGHAHGWFVMNDVLSRELEAASLRLRKSVQVANPAIPTEVKPVPYGDEKSDAGLLTTLHNQVRDDEVVGEYTGAAVVIERECECQAWCCRFWRWIRRQWQWIRRSG